LHAALRAVEGPRVKLRLIVVGRDKKDPMVVLANEYLDRIGHTFPITLVEIKEEPAREKTPVDRVRALEAERIKKALLPGEHLIALDERGKALSSREIADRLRAFSMEGRSQVAFVIGGPEGLDPALVKEAKESWSLSRLTLPHRLARLLLAEQIYRACTIIRGEPYHR
jgi:23S rRNA (pseudouridine1915-N3)-methyltransferase